MDSILPPCDCSCTDRILVVLSSAAVEGANSGDGNGVARGIVSVMYSTEIAGDWASEQVWGWHAARRFVNDAIEELEHAGVALVPLIADTDWQADGVRKLHATIEHFREQCATAESSLRMRLWELEAAR